jgi:AcrR family transcriptional regulator
MDTTRGRRHARTAQAMLDAALEILTESNIEALSMREIARRIEYSPSGLYEYFACKDELLDALRQHGFVKLTEYLNRMVRGSTAAQRLLEASSAYLDFARRNPQLYLLMFNRMPPEASEGKTLAQRLEDFTVNTAFAVLLAIIRAGVESGAFKIDPQLEVAQLAYSSWAYLHGLAMLRLTLLSTAAEEIDAKHHEILRAFVASMGGP